MLESELTEDTINSEEFAAAFKTAANLDQANGSEHTTDDNGNLMQNLIQMVRLVFFSMV